MDFLATFGILLCWPTRRLNGPILSTSSDLYAYLTLPSSKIRGYLIVLSMSLGISSNITCTYLLLVNAFKSCASKNRTAHLERLTVDTKSACKTMMIDTSYLVHFKWSECEKKLVRFLIFFRSFCDEYYYIFRLFICWHCCDCDCVQFSHFF